MGYLTKAPLGLGLFFGGLVLGNVKLVSLLGSGGPDLESDFTFPAFAWGIAFTATGATALIASLTDDAVKASSGGQLGGLIVGGTFIVMGLPVLLLSLKYLVADLLRRGERPATAAEREKAKVLSE